MQCITPALAGLLHKFKHRNIAVIVILQDGFHGFSITRDFAIFFAILINTFNFCAAWFRELVFSCRGAFCILAFIKTERLRSTLKQYYPQMLEWFERLDTVLVCDFITRWPTLTQLKRARKGTLEKFFHEHNMRFSHVLETRLKSIKAAMPLTLDAAVVMPYSLQVLVLTDQLRVSLQQSIVMMMKLLNSHRSTPITVCSALTTTSTRQRLYLPGAVRALAFKWIRILYRCWQTRTPYNESVYECA